ncbi:PEP-CTERM sorting domain-containing protein [Dapis sp. BLCC M126]|uniref:PEP-CTERM sorting domain-containing protein n=1 Tax=Dapis sp. BLCC M126 TaxID=3400189 RepID=UPI003CEEF424
MKNQIVASIAAIPFAVGTMFAGTGAAEAAALSGNITINGNGDISGVGGGVTKVDFIDVDDIMATGDFAKFDPDFTATPVNSVIPVDSPNYINIQDLYLTPTGFNPSVDPLVSFIDFGERTLQPGGEVGNLTFDLYEPEEENILIVGEFVASFKADGVWKFNGETIAEGGVSMTDAGVGSYTISLTVATPEPTTLFGLGVVATGLVASRRKKSS